MPFSLFLLEAENEEKAKMDRIEDMILEGPPVLTWRPGDVGRSTLPPREEGGRKGIGGGRKSCRRPPPPRFSSLKVRKEYSGCNMVNFSVNECGHSLAVLALYLQCMPSTLLFFVKAHSVFCLFTSPFCALWQFYLQALGLVCAVFPLM